MNANYLVSLNLSNKEVVIIGGGKIAERKANNLLDTGAKIIVVSPKVTGNIADMAEKKQLTWRKKPFSQDDIKTAFMIIAATNHKPTNLFVKRVATENQLVCLVDNPDESDFQTPIILRRGKLGIAISTSGASPLLAKKIHKQLEATFDERYAEYLEFLYNCRKIILEKVEDNVSKQQLLIEIINPHYIDSSDREQEFQILLAKVNKRF